MAELCFLVTSIEAIAEVILGELSRYVSNVNVRKSVQGLNLWYDVKVDRYGVGLNPAHGPCPRKSRR